MKKILFLMVAALVIAGCSKSDDEKKDSTVDFTLSKTEVNLTVDDETRIEVIGVNIDECEVYSEDEFIAYVIKHNGKIDIEADHAGETDIVVKCKDIEKTCKVKIAPSVDFIVSTVTEWGIKKEELKSKVEQPYESFYTNSQTNSTDVSYVRSGYRITNSYYFDNSGLIGVKKSIVATGTDTQVLLNITNSMREWMKYISSSSSTINSYPKAYRSSNIYSHPEKYHAVYEQTRYDILYETGKRPATRNYIYFAKDLETAKNHNFTN